MLEDIWNELIEGEIHHRDQLQFELKNEFLINPHLKENIYRQEVYLFIPNSLQINSQTYSKQQFYLDQTNLIRYKTPQISLKDLVNPDYTPSPLNRLQSILNQEKFKPHLATASDELKLFGAVMRASAREQIYDIIKKIKLAKSLADQKEISEAISRLSAEIGRVDAQFKHLQEIAFRLHSKEHQLIRHFKYLDEFLSTTLEGFWMVLLQDYRAMEQHNPQTDHEIVQLILKERFYQQKNHIGPKTTRGHLFANESILYRQGLLNQFILEALTLKSYRFSVTEKHVHLIGALTAGLAMFFYMSLFVWKSSDFVINSFPFVFLAVVLYILKDRLKEGLKTFYYRKAPLWFPDYSTEISSSKGYKVGKLTENFAFIDSKELPSGFLKIRNHHFHEELQALQRHESIIQYKRDVVLHIPIPFREERRREITTIFRLNIHRFLEKSSDPSQLSLSLDPYSHEISERMLPKVYHLNLIIRNTYFQGDQKPKVEIKTFRVVIDKSGIKRAEHIRYITGHYEN